ncbi:MAG: DUF1570 domain-containing protein [Planctomycetales bacterium]|nr:DUF1570 domain-containing protein [Planctomycetales bacterium]
MPSQTASLLSYCLQLPLWLACGLSGHCGLAVEPRQWPVELKVGRFEIHSDFDVASQASLLPELSGLAGDVSHILGLAAGEQPVHIVLFRTGREYQRYMRNYFPDLPERRALFIQDRGPGMLFAHWHQDVAVDLRHEITHALLNDGLHPLPLWLDEGLAEYFEIEGGRRFDGNAYLPQVVERAERGLVPSLAQLEEIDDLQQFQDAHYRDSWAWVHFLIHRQSETRQLLVRYLNDYRSGAQRLNLARQLQQILADPNASYQAHFQSFPGS